MRQILSLSFLLLAVLAGAQSTTIINANFESSPVGAHTGSTSIGGWTLSSQTATTCGANNWVPGSPEFSIITTPQLFVPYIGILPNSPLGGNKIAVLNNTTANANQTKIAQTVSIAPSSSLVTFAYAGYWDYGTHPCCEQTGFKVQLRDQSNNILTCPYFPLTGNGCNTGPTYTVTNGVAWTNWQQQYIDLTVFTGSVLTLEIIAFDCIHGDHYGQTFFDFTLVPPVIGPCNCVYNPPSPFSSFCPGTTSAVIQAPLGFASYSWTAPASAPLAPGQSTMAVLSVTNALANNVYSLTVVSVSGFCLHNLTHTLVPNGLNLLGVGSSSSCASGSAGSASVMVTGSPGGYNYVWTNSLSATVGTNSVVAGLSPGPYTVVANVIGVPSCSVTATTTVNAGTNSFQQVIRPYCSGPVSLNPGTGINYQWYSNLSPIPPSSNGNNPTYTVTNPSNLQIIRVGWQSSSGCRDSVAYTLVSVPPGSLALVSSNTPCSSSTNGQAIFSITPAVVAPSSITSAFSGSSNHSSTPQYSFSGNVSANSFTINNLSASGIYSVTASDGYCSYNRTFTIGVAPQFTSNFSATAYTVCSGSPLAVALNAQGAASQFGFAWTPTTNIFVNADSSAILSASLSPNTSTTITYSVAITPTAAFCPLTKTFTATFLHPGSATISPIPDLCQTQAYTLSALPVGGIWSGSGPSANGTISSGKPAGIHSANYLLSGCVAASATFAVVAPPALTVSSPSLICQGETATLVATGASSYSWSTGGVTASQTVAPASTATYIVTGNGTLTGCSSTKTVIVGVVPQPSVLASSIYTVCQGQPATLSVTPGMSYLWSNGQTSASITVQPVNNAVYSVTITTSLASCSAAASTTLQVIPNPTVAITGNTTICAGDSLKLIASGAATYKWNNLNTTAQLAVIPGASGTYSVIGSTAGCSDTAYAAVKVNLCTALESLMKGSLRIYPNPATDRIYIESDKKCTISLFDQAGKLVRQFVIDGSGELSISELPAGPYILQANDGSEIRKAQFLKQ